ncbi:MAG: hypothetical protein ACC683_04940 [Acidimicrobiia bacterium]
MSVLERATKVGLIVAVVVAAMLVVAVGAAVAAPPDRAGVIAVFEGEKLNLAQSWGEAEACLIWQQEGISECFRNEAEMDARVAELDAEVALTRTAGGVAAASTCSGYLRLYDRTWYGSPVLYLRDRYEWLNLSDYGFNQRTSSYKVGPCSSYFADYSNGGGDWYPTHLTEANDQSGWMNSGWNNDVSSVYIS